MNTNKQQIIFFILLSIFITKTFQQLYNYQYKNPASTIRQRIVQQIQTNKMTWDRNLNKQKHQIQAKVDLIIKRYGFQGFFQYLEYGNQLTNLFKNLDDDMLTWLSMEFYWHQGIFALVTGEKKFRHFFNKKKNYCYLSISQLKDKIAGIAARQLQRRKQKIKKTTVKIKKQLQKIMILLTQEKLFKNFEDPITGQMMKEPMNCFVCGNSYERETIIASLNYDARCSLCRQQLFPAPNLNLKNCIQYKKELQTRKTTLEEELIILNSEFGEI